MNIDELIATLTRDEKIALLSGADQWHTVSIPRLEIPAIMLADGPHGLRKQVAEGDHLGIGVSAPATCFPPAATSANSWDPELLFAMGKAIGREALHAGVSVVLGPGINIKRSPLCGRNFEYFSEDPFLSGELASAWVEGIQSLGVGASLKHFAANNQEKWRMLNDSLVDERALREIYLRGFERTIKKSQPWTVMGAYNKLNGIYCCEHPELLDSILRQEWGFRGAVVTDWGALNDPGRSLRAGLDLEMPASYGVTATKIRHDLETGELSEAILDKPVRRVLDLIAKASAPKADVPCDFTAHHNLARKIAAESAVLLKNEAAILPLAKEQKLAVMGQFAHTPRYQGTGSSQINPTRLDTVLTELEREDMDFRYAKGYHLDSDLVDETIIAEACQIAKDADVAIIFAGLTAQYESEGYDRTHLELPTSHNELIRRVAEVNPRVVVVLAAGSPVTMPWIEEVPAVLHTYLPGQAGAGATLDLLFGRINPSGKLAESYPYALGDNPVHTSFASERAQTEYRESIFVGYRYYDAAAKEVLFPFGYGLSYTQFSYTNLQLSKRRCLDTETITVSCQVTNTGERAGAEVVQLYVGKEDSPLFRSPRELKGFRKLYLQPGETKQVEFRLDKHSFAYYNVDIKDWHVEEGEYTIQMGASSRDLPLSETLYLKTSQLGVRVPDYRRLASAYYGLNESDGIISKAQFKAVYGKELPQIEKYGTRFHNNSTLQDLQSTILGRLVLKFARHYLWKMTAAQDEQDPLWLMTWNSAMEMPLRSIVALSGGTIPNQLVQGLLAWVNGQYGQALKHWSKK